MLRRLVLVLTLLAAGCQRDLEVPSLERVVISPAFTNVAPRQTVQFEVAGGAGVYTFGFAAGGQLSGTDATVDQDGLYTAGSAGSAQDIVEVSDGAGRKATAKVQVGTPLKLYRSESRPVAPRETVAFIAFGGQPPYQFSVVASGSGNPTVGEITGAYTAGDRAADSSPDSVVTDTVMVRDSSAVPQAATMAVQVGPRLRLRLDSAEVFPGVAAQLVAEGGKPPYAFGFAARVQPDPLTGVGDPLRENGGNGGNRSRGTVNAFSGEYVPGFSPGAIDFFQVTDATSAPPAILAGPRVGGAPIAIGAGARRCVAGDFNGDRSEDVAVAIEGDGIDKLTIAQFVDTPDPFVQAYYMDRSARGVSFASDFAGVGRDELLFVGGDTRCPDGGCSGSPDLWAMVPDLAGFMSFEQVLGGTEPGASLGIRNGTGTYNPTSLTWSFYTDVDGGGGCAGGSTAQDRALLRIDWPAWDPAPTTTCLLAEGFCPTCTDGEFGDHFSPIALAVGDYDADGNIDLAWILSTDSNSRAAEGSSGAQVYVSYGNGGTTFPPPSSGWPTPAEPWSFDTQGASPQSAFLTVKDPSGRDALAVRLTNLNDGRSTLFLLRDPSTTAWDTFLPDVDGAVAYAPAPGAALSYVAWSGDDGVLTGFGIDPSFAFTAVSTVATVPFAVNAVCMPDVNADGTPDLVAAGEWSSSAQLLLGEGQRAEGSAASVRAGGNGTFATHAHLRGATFPVAVGDLDGDGFGDAVAANAGGAGLSVLWGGGGMLAWGPQVSSASIGAAAVADFTGEGRPSILYQEKSGRFAGVRSRGDGTFDPAVSIPGSAATGGAPGAFFFMWPGDLGTSAPGVDLLTSEFGDAARVRALLVQDDGAGGRRIVDVRAEEFPAFDGTYTRQRDCWPLAVPTTTPVIPAVVAICSFVKSGGDEERVIAVFGATISNPDGAPGTTADAPAFGDWVTLTTTTVGTNAFTMPSSTASATFIGNVTPRADAPRTALFAMRTDKLYAVEVRKTPGDWEVNPFPVTPDTHATPFLGAAGPMDATSAFHVAVAGEDGTVILKRTAAGYELVQRLSTRAFPMGIAPLSTLPSGIRSPGDVVTFNGDFSNTGLTPEIIPLLNDGTGKVR